MGSGAQLKLVALPAPKDTYSTSTDPVRRVFDHWLFMFGRSPNRCKLDQARRTVIAAALLLYDEDQLFAAVEGMAADPLEDCRSEKMRAAMREVEWLLARSARIERWADMGDALRLQARRATEREANAASVEAAPPVDPAEVARVRERLRAMAAARREASNG